MTRHETALVARLASDPYFGQSLGLRNGHTAEEALAAALRAHPDPEPAPADAEPPQE